MRMGRVVSVFSLSLPLSSRKSGSLLDEFVVLSWGGCFFLATDELPEELGVRLGQVGDLASSRWLGMTSGVCRSVR